MSWREYLLEHRWQKLFALGLAVLIWFTVRSTEGLRLADDASDGTRLFDNVPIVVLTSAADLGRYEVSPSRVRIELSGAPERLREMTPSMIEAYVNLVDLGRTPQTIHIHVNPPAGTVVTQVEPVKILVDRLSESNSSKSSP
jgi:hypothetical protein